MLLLQKLDELCEGFLRLPDGVDAPGPPHQVLSIDAPGVAAHVQSNSVFRIRCESKGTPQHKPVSTLSQPSALPLLVFPLAHPNHAVARPLLQPDRGTASCFIAFLPASEERRLLGANSIRAYLDAPAGAVGV